MFSVFRYSKRITTQNIIQTKHLLFLPFSERTHKFSNLVDTKDNSSYTVNYLVNSCGLSQENAKSASQKVKFKLTERADLVLELLKNNGFNKSQISHLVKRFPCVLSYDPEKTLLPKLNFFKSIGVLDIGKVVSSDPNLLLSSLEDRMKPTYKVVKSVIGCNEKMVTLCERSSWVVYSRNVVQNIEILREIEVPPSNIELLLNHFPLAIIQNNRLFRVAVCKAKEMGFDPLKSNFVQAVRVFSGKGNKLIWDRCSEEYKKWGWSEEDILSAFKKHPSCMIVSGKKIEKTMGFLVDKFGCDKESVVSFPALFNFSLEKRIIPRCLVIQVLMSKGILNKMSLRTILLPSDKLFLERFVARYESQLPQLMTVYQGDADILAL